jgi:hypothetical protein
MQNRRAQLRLSQAAERRAQEAAALKRSDAAGPVDYSAHGFEAIPGARPTADDVKKAKGGAAAHGDLISAAQELADIAGRTGVIGGVPYGEERAKGDAAVGRFAAAYKEAKQLGALDRGVLELVEKVAGGNPARMSWHKQEVLSQLVADLRDSRDRALKAHGFRMPETRDAAPDVTPGYTPD